MPAAASGTILGMPRTPQEIELDAKRNLLARQEMMRKDGARSLGENLEQLDALIKDLFELARGFAERSG
jgi:hypothetical protein